MTTRKTTKKKVETKKAPAVKAKATKRKAKKRMTRKPPGKAVGVKVDEMVDRTPVEFRLKIKPDSQIFWSVTAQTWVVWVETETGRQLSKKLPTHEMAMKLERDMCERGSINPYHWKSDIYWHANDIMSWTMIRRALVEAGGSPGLTHGTIGNDEDMWYVWVDGLKAEPIPIWSTSLRSFTRVELINLRRVISIYKAGYDYAMKQK